MLTQYFFIEDYDWSVHAFYYVEPIDRYKLIHIFKKFNYNNVVPDINMIVSVTNGGYCYTNYSDKRSIMVVNKASNSSQMHNTIVHELNHLSSHIEEYYNIDPHSERASYLIGGLAQVVYNFLNHSSSSIKPSII